MAHTVFITGCDSGIGLATAHVFHNHGWNVVATMLHPDSDVGREYAEKPRTLVTKLDVLNLANIDAAVQAAISKFGRIDVLVNNAGFGQYGVLEAIPREKIRAQYAVNVFGVIDVIKAVLPHMRSNDPVNALNGRRGIIINMGSGSGLFCLPVMALYSSTKTALAGLTEAISYELSSQSIATKLIVPYSGVTHTSFFDSTQFANDETAAPYKDFVNAVMGRYNTIIPGLTLTSEDVAGQVYEAALDKSDKVKYYIGHDAADMFKNRMEMSEDEYIQYMRKTLM